ncbi:arginine N-succinyltransferase [bacterium]|nr:arginine N-succinyltransferase [bacterium]
MDVTTEIPQPPARSGWKLFLIVFAAMLAAVIVGLLLARWWLFPSQLTPVELRSSEQVVVNQKLQALGVQQAAFPQSNAPPGDGERLEPQPYSEAGASREVRFSERELNGLLAKNTDLAQKLAIDLSDNLASARLVLPLDPDFPILGGQTLRMNAGLEVAFSDGRPRIVLRGVSAWGVPLPNAWLGNLKQVDLVAQYGAQDGFWKAFADGIETIDVRDGQIYVKLRE